MQHRRKSLLLRTALGARLRRGPFFLVHTRLALVIPTLINNLTGIIAPSLKLRNSQVLANQVGIVVDNVEVDLGRTGTRGTIPSAAAA